MSQKTRKAQVVVIGLSPQDQSLHVLLFKTNSQRGSFWQNVTGKIEADESWSEGAAREFQEETQFSMENLIQFTSLDLEHEFKDRWKREVVEKSFLAFVKELSSPKLDPTEHQDFKWLSIDQINREHYAFESNYEAFRFAKDLLLNGK